MQRLVILVLFIIHIHGSVQGQNHTERNKRIDALLQQQVPEHGPGAVVGVIQNGQFTYKSSFGMANLDYDIPLTTSSVFRIASTAKQVTAATIFLMEAQSLVSTEDDIRKYLPDFPDYGHAIRIKHLIYHTSGIRDYTGLMYLWGDSDFVGTPEDLYELIVRQKALDFEPGTQFSYSNSAYFLIGQIVKKVTGKSLAEFAQEHIFTPLDMNNTHYHDNHNMIVKNRAYGYSESKDGFEMAMSSNDIVGDGGIFTTLDDWAKWDANFYSAKVGGPEFIEKMTTVNHLNNGKPTVYAGGLFIRQYRGIQKVAHSGAYAGFKSSVARYPQEHTSIIIFSNGGLTFPPRLTNTLANIVLEGKLAEVKRRPPADQKAPVEVPKEISEKLKNALIGKYYSEELDFSYTLLKKGEKLYCKMGYEKAFELFTGKDGQLMIDEYISIQVSLPDTGMVQEFGVSVGDTSGILFRRVI